MTINYVTLGTEITTDPKGLGYAGKSDYEIATLLNTPGLSSETIFRGYTPIEEVVACLVAAEVTALSTANQTLLDKLLRGSRLKTGDANLRTAMGAVFANGTTSRANLIAVASRPASRAEALFGENTSITDVDVARALGRG